MLDRGELAKLASALGGLPVLGCRPGSPADAAGVRYGDIVLAVNSVKTPDWATFIEARALNKDSMLVELFRDGASVIMELSLLEAAPVDPPTLLAELIAERIVPLNSTPVGIDKLGIQVKPN
jgi:S1-C subfamily serine protease